MYLHLPYCNTVEVSAWTSRILRKLSKVPIFCTVYCEPVVCQIILIPKIGIRFPVEVRRELKIQQNQWTQKLHQKDRCSKTFMVTKVPYCTH